MLEDFVLGIVKLIGYRRRGRNTVIIRILTSKASLEEDFGGNIVIACESGSIHAKLRESLYINHKAWHCMHILFKADALLEVHVVVVFK